MATATEARKAKAREPRFYRLKAGTHSEFETVDDGAGGRVTRVTRTYRSNEPKNNVVRSTENLAAMEPSRWEETSAPPQMDDEEFDPRFLEPPPPMPTDAGNVRPLALPTDREARRKALERELEAMDKEDENDGAGDAPSVDEAIEHQRTLMGKSDAADAALEDFEARQKELAKSGGRPTTQGAPAGQVLVEGSDEELSKMNKADLEKRAKRDGVALPAGGTKEQYLEAFKAAKK